MIIVRKERESDFPHIREILANAYGRRNEADLVEFVRDATSTAIGLVAVDDGQSVGYAMLTPVWVDDGSSPIGVGIGPVAVVPDRQGEGFGTALIRHALAVCKREGISVVVALGYPDYYRRFGFSPAVDAGLHSAYDAFDDSFMAIELDEDALGEISGTIRYLDAFTDT